jgi:hypothetical protein
MVASLHVLPDRFVRIRYYSLLANRHRGQALAFRGAVSQALQYGRSLPSPIGSLCSRASPRPEQVQGLRAERLASRRRTGARASPEGSAAMIRLPIAQCPYLLAQPWSGGFVYLGGSLRYNHLHEIAFRSMGMRQIHWLGSPLKASRRLSGFVWGPAGCRAKCLWRIESP